MALITRLTRLFHADVHAVLDRLEEPVTVLRQAIREMEDEVRRSAQQLKSLEIDQQQTQSRIEALHAGLATIAGELDLCFAASNEPLIRTLLRRRLESERMAAHLARRQATLAQDIARCRAALDDQRQRLDAMRQKASLFDAEPASGTGREAAYDTAPDYTVSDADVDVALLREQQQRKSS
jgi:phage shock protein A